jgi:predicted RNase H-like HicB family nuclease
MREPLRLTIAYTTGDDGWIIASVPEVPGAHSQGRTRKEARANVIDALRGVLELRLGEHAINEPGGDRESLELVIASSPARPFDGGRALTPRATRRGTLDVVR